MMTCFGCCGVFFPANNPQRFVQGTLLMLLGSLAWLVLEVLDRQTRGQDVTEQDETLEKASNITALIISCILVELSAIALVFHIMCIRKIRKEQNKAASTLEQSQDQNQERTLWEWFIYPDLETVSAERQLQSLQNFKTAYHELVWSQHARVYLLAPAVSLFGIILLRLVWGAESFEGNKFFLDFGWKYGLVPHGRDTTNFGQALYNEPAEKIVAFKRELGTYILAVQGWASAWFAFPVVATPLLRLANWTWWQSLVRLLPYALTIYPTYDLVKTMRMASEAFAGSSFNRNGLEFNMGFLVACAMGNVVTSIVLLHRLREADTKDNDTEGQQDEKSPTWWKQLWNQEKQKPRGYILMFQTLFGLLFWATVATTAVMLGLSWQSCLPRSPDMCVNAMALPEKTQASLIAIFGSIPLGIWVATQVMLSRSNRNRETNV